MKTAFATALSLALAAAPAFAQVTPAPATDAAGIYQVYRTTDSQLSCEQVIGELNLLNQQIKAQADARASQQAAAQQAVSQPKRGGGFGSLMGAVAQSGLAGSIPGVGGLARNPMAAQAAMAAMNAAANGAAQSAANQQAAAQAQLAAASAQPASDSNEMQRLRRVQSLMQTKSC